MSDWESHRANGCVASLWWLMEVVVLGNGAGERLEAEAAGFFMVSFVGLLPRL
jgi:hypothetical protein